MKHHHHTGTTSAGTIAAGIVIGKAVTSPRFGRMLVWVILFFLLALIGGAHK